MNNVPSATFELDLKKKKKWDTLYKILMRFP